MLLFTVSDRWRDSYPGAGVGVLAMENVVNPVEHAQLEKRKAALEAQLRERYAGLDRAGLRALPHIQPYDAYYKRFKKTYHVLQQLESVALKGQPLPRVAALVEAMFMAELQNQLLTAGHDLAAVEGPAGIDVAEGGEHYVALNGAELTAKAGDMFIADRQGILSTILYGPDRRTRIRPDTRQVLFTVYSPPGIPEEAVAQHLLDIQGYVQLVAGNAQVMLRRVYGGA